MPHLKKIVLVDNVASRSSETTTFIDNKEILKYSKDQGSAFGFVVELMNRLPSEHVSGRSVKEWFKLRNHSLWWFAHGSLWRHIDANINFIINFENMLETIKPDIVHVEGFYDKIDLIQQICRKKNVKLRIGFKLRIRIFVQSLKRKRIKQTTSIDAKQKKSRRIALAKGANRVNVENVGKGCVIHVAHETYRRRIYDFETGEVKEGEFIAQKILQQIKRKGADTLGIDVDHTSEGEFSVLEGRLKDKDQYWVPLEIFEDSKVSDKELERTMSEFRQRLVSHFNNTEFQQLFTFRGIRLWRTLKIRFDLLTESLPQRIRTIEVAKGILQRFEPRSVFLLYEKGPSAMTFIIAADELQIKTVGMQHGIIHDSHPDYAITDLRVQESNLGSPIPTVMVVFGEYYMKLLTEKLAYPPSRVIVGGNPTYESANIHSTKLDRKGILTRLNLDPERKTVLVATSMGQKKYGQFDYDVILLETLAKSFANDKGIQVVTKLHPKEDGAVYKKIIEEYKTSNFSIINHPIEELILVCDVFVAVATTAILEAIILEKPVIVIRATDKVDRDVFSLVERGAAVGAKYDELTNKILDLLDNTDLVAKLRKKGSEFAKEHFNLPNKEISSKIADILTDSERKS